MATNAALGSYLLRVLLVLLARLLLESDVSRCFGAIFHATDTQTASHHLDKASILTMVISSLEECILNYVPQVQPPKVDSI